jgi:hypothetical protein
MPRGAIAQWLVASRLNNGSGRITANTEGTPISGDFRIAARNPVNERLALFSSVEMQNRSVILALL